MVPFQQPAGFLPTAQCCQLSPTLCVRTFSVSVRARAKRAHPGLPEGGAMTSQVMLIQDGGSQKGNDDSLFLISHPTARF